MKNVAKIFLKIFLILSITTGIWTILTPIFRPNDTPNPLAFNSIPKDSMDIIILGSSHAQYSMNPGIINKESGYYSYVLGSGCQPVMMSYHFLKEAIKTQRPEVVAMDVFTFLPAQSVCYADGMFYNAIQQMTGVNKLEAAYNIDNKDIRYDYMFDLRITHGRWKENNFAFGRNNITNVKADMGYIFMEPKDLAFRHLIPFERENINITLKEKDLKYFKKIVELCDKENIKLILFKAPFTIDQQNYDSLQKVWDYAEASGIEYIDFLEIAEEIGWVTGMDGDTWHNTSWGAEKVSRYFAEYIKENNYIKNHQDNETVNKIIAKLNNKTIEQLCLQKIDIYQLLMYAQKYEMTILLKYNGANFTTIGEYENNLLQSVGINKDFISNKTSNYYAIIKNNEVIVESDSEVETVINGKTITINYDKITVGNETFDSSSQMEIVFSGENLDWFQPIGIDYATRYFWHNQCDGWNCTFN